MNAGTWWVSEYNRLNGRSVEKPHKATFTFTLPFQQLKKVQPLEEEEEEEVEEEEDITWKVFLNRDSSPNVSVYAWAYLPTNFEMSSNARNCSTVANSDRRND